jgi:hypothetical protein
MIVAKNKKRMIEDGIKFDEQSNYIGSSAQLDRISAAFECILSIRHTQFCEFVLLIPILGP